MTTNCWQRRQGWPGSTISEFLLERALTDAAEIVDTHRTIRLADDDLARFMRALDGPVRPPKVLMAQVRKARRLKRGD